MLRWLAFAVMLTGVIGVVYCADRGMLWMLYDWFEKHPGADKVGHFFLFGSLAYVLTRALGGRFLLGGLLVAVGVTLEECSQIWIPSRSFDLKDLAANYAGIALAGLLNRWQDSRS